MQRTTIRLPAGLKALATHAAKERGMSLGGLIRLALKREVERSRRARGATVFEFVTFSRGKRGNIAPRVRDYLYGKCRR